MKRNLTHMLSLLLAVMMLTQTLCLSSFAEGSTAAASASGTEAEYADYTCAQPVLGTVVCTANGLTVSWSKVDGASRYCLLYRTEDGWSELGTTTAVKITDTTVKSGETRCYTVCCVDENGTHLSSYDTDGISGTYIAPPELVSVTAETDGVLLSWNAPDGAESYRVFYKNSAGKWAGLANTSDTEYLDTSLSIGSTRTYTVRCMNAGNTAFTSAYDTAGISITRAAQPQVTAVTCTADGLSVSWSASEGASLYSLLYLDGDEWTALGTTSATKLTDATVPSGTTRTYSVCCVDADGNRVSTFDTTGMSGTYVAAPVLTGAVPTADGALISWEASAGAGSYRIYYKNTAGKWTGLATTSDTEYLDTAITSGSSRTYTVRCMNADRTAFISAYDTAGISISYASQPQITSVTYAAKGLTVTWDAVSGAQKYSLMYRADDAWKTLGTTTAVKVLDTTVTSGETRCYTVCCVDEDGTQTSSYDDTGVSGTYIAPPTLVSVNPGADGAVLTWEASAGAELYRVYYKNDSGKWTGLANTADTSFTDTTITSGTSRTYTVRCMNADGTAFTSAYDTAGLTISYTAQPVITSLSNTASGVRVTWDAVTGADRYRLFYKTDGKWTFVVTTSDTSYTFTNATNDTDYKFTLYCIDSDGNQTSSYDTEGTSIHFYAAPTLSSASGTPSAITVSWDAVDGISNYRVYYKDGSSGWKKLADTAETTYTDTGSTVGTVRSYTVRCLNEDSNALVSGFDAAGISCVRLATPGITDSAMQSGTSLKLSWSTVSGATGYYICQQKSSGGWSLLKTVNSGDTSSVVLKDLTYGNTYTFTVRAFYSSTNSSSKSGYDTSGYTVEMLATSKKVNGYTLYYDNNGNLICDAEYFVGTQSAYLIKVNLQCNTTTVYAKDSSGNYTIPVKVFLSSGGDGTPTGTYSTSQKLRWQTLVEDTHGQWCTRITGSILFHSVWYYEEDNTTLSVDEFNKLGTTCSHGCIRLDCEDAKWIYDNCALGTKVTLYNSSDPGPLGKPDGITLPSWHTWDPTDPNVQDLCKEHGCHAYA